MEELKSNNKGLSGFALKMIGIILMVFDHIHQMFYMFGVPLWFTALGRPVAPIFLYLSAQGFHYTKNKKKYLFRLWLSYVLMAVASMLIQRALPSQVVLMNSIFGTLFLSAFYMWMIDFFKSGIKEKKASNIALSIVGMLLPVILNVVMMLLLTTAPQIVIFVMNVIPLPLFVEGSYVWIILGVCFYLLREKNKWIQIIPLLIFSILSFVRSFGQPANIQWLMIFAAIPILLYNGKEGKKNKYFFYIFYPAHIYILYVISFLLQPK